MNPTQTLSNQNGVAFVIALIMLLILTLIGLGSVSTATYETNIAGNERAYNLAFYTADGGVENFRGRLSAGEFIYTALNTGNVSTTIGGNNCSISYSKTAQSDAGGNYAVFKVRSEGRAPFPSKGKVVIESIIEAPMQKPEGY